MNITIRNYFLQLEKIISYFLITLGLVILIYGLSTVDYSQLSRIHFYIITSGSMVPDVPLGSVVVSQPQINYLSNDIITFVNTDNTKETVTHRILAKEYPQGVRNDPVYLTKGDTNKTVDLEKIRNNQIQGKVVLTIPYLGYMIDFAKSPKGFIFLIVVPATIIIYEELKNIKQGLTIILNKIKKRIKPDKPLFKPVPSSQKYSTLIILIPIIGSVLVLASVSRSIFLDRETSSANYFKVAAIFETPPPIATTLVINEVLPVSNCKLGNDFAQWLEIYNGFSVPKDLKDYKITDGTNIISIVNAVTIVPAGGLALLSHDNSTWTKCYADNGVITANLGGQLDINSKKLQLLDGSNVVLDDVEWSGSTGLNPLTNQSIERIQKGYDTALGSLFNVSDFTVKSTPTPGI